MGSAATRSCSFFIEGLFPERPAVPKQLEPVSGKLRVKRLICKQYHVRRIFSASTGMHINLACPEGQRRVMGCRTVALAWRQTTALATRQMWDLSDPQLSSWSSTGWTGTSLGAEVGCSARARGTQDTRDRRSARLAAIVATSARGLRSAVDPHPPNPSGNGENWG